MSTFYDIQFQRGTKLKWEAVNPVLLAGEPGYELDTGKLKIGNGIDKWKDLKYLINETENNTEENGIWVENWVDITNELDINKGYYERWSNGQLGGTIEELFVSNSQAECCLIPVQPGDRFKAFGFSLYNVSLATFFDSGRNRIANDEYWNESGYLYNNENEEINIPSNCSYIGFASWTDASNNSNARPLTIKKLQKTFVSSNSEKIWANKKWVAIGDSLTERNTNATKFYHDYISENTGITVINEGISGTGYCKTNPNQNDAFYQRIEEYNQDINVITIFGSGNDLSTGLDLGDINDINSDNSKSLCGYINLTINTLYEKNPTANLGIITPTPWGSYNNYQASPLMRLYSEKIVEICKNRGIPCLDLYNCSGLRPWENGNFAYTNKKEDGTYDTVHPNELGHKVIAPRIKAFLETLIM